jgi:hypothetical protein
MIRNAFAFSDQTDLRARNRYEQFFASEFDHSELSICSQRNDIDHPDRTRGTARRWHTKL